MCGRNSLFIDQADLEARFDAEVVTDGGYTPRYNIAPGDDLDIEAGLEVCLVDEERVPATHTEGFGGRHLQRGRTGISPLTNRLSR